MAWLGGLVWTPRHPLPASRKRHLRRRAALGQLSTILLAARPVLWRRQRWRVTRLGGAAARAAPGRSQAALVAKLPSPDSVHPPSPTAQGPRPQRSLLVGLFPLLSAWPGQAGASRRSLPSFIPAHSQGLPSCLPGVPSHPLQPSLGAHHLSSPP